MNAEVASRVLVVDDDLSVLAAAAKALRGEGYEVLTAASGEEALHIAQEVATHMDVVVMDIFLPDAWGSSLAFTLKQNYPSIRVVYMSGYAKSDPLLNAIRDPSVILLAKPFELSELVGAVRIAVAKGAVAKGEAG